MKKDRPPQLHSFTLFELVIVLAIISAMTMVLMPYAGNSNKSLKLKQHCLDIAETIKYAIDLAVNTQRPTRLAINVKNKSYLLEMATQTNNYQPIEGFHGAVRYIRKTAHIIDMEGFYQDANDCYIVFDPAKKWPSASFSLSSQDLIKTIKIEGKRIEIEESTI